MIKKIQDGINEVKEIVEEKIKDVNQLPTEKIILGAIATFAPGGMLISGVYLTRKKYEEYCKNNNNPEPFLTWFEKESKDYLKDTTENAKKIVNTVTEKTKEYTDVAEEQISDLVTNNALLNETTEIIESGINKTTKIIKENAKKIADFFDDSSKEENRKNKTTKKLK